MWQRRQKNAAAATTMTNTALFPALRRRSRMALVPPPAASGDARPRPPMRYSVVAAGLGPVIPGDWLSGRAPRSHRGGHWFDPSIAHQLTGRFRFQEPAFFIFRQQPLSGRKLFRPVSQIPGEELGGLIAAGRPGADCFPQVGGQGWVVAVEEAQGALDADGHGFPGLFRCRRLAVGVVHRGRRNG